MFTVTAPNAHTITAPTPICGPNTGPAASVNGDNGNPASGNNAMAVKNTPAPASLIRPITCPIPALSSSPHVIHVKTAAASSAIPARIKVRFDRMG